MKMHTKKNSFKKEFYESTMPFIYNIGAAVVILGAMFKLLNLPGGSMMLGIGLTTEALIFILSSFEPKEQALDWTRVYPELAGTHKGTLPNHMIKTTPPLTQKLDKCLQQAHIDTELLDNLATSMRHFAENISSVPSFSRINEVTEGYINHVTEATQAIAGIAKISHAISNTLHSFSAISSEHTLQNYLTQIDEMVHTVTAINVHYKKELVYMEEKPIRFSMVANHFQTTFQTMEVAGNEALHFKKELTLLNEKVTALNEIYAKALTAFKS